MDQYIYYNVENRTLQNNACFLKFFVGQIGLTYQHMNWLTFSQSQHLDNQANTVELLSTPEVAGLLPSTWPSSPTRAFVRFDIIDLEG